MYNATNNKLSITGYHLKLIGITLMVFDHLGAFSLIDTPVWFGWLGRPVAIIFLFLSAEGYFYSKHITRYFSLLMIGFWFVNGSNYLLDRFLPINGVELYANIFGALFLSVLFMLYYDFIVKKIKDKNYLSLFFILILGGLYIGLDNLLISYVYNDRWLSIVMLVAKIVPFPSFSEGGYLYPLVGLSFYILRNSKIRLLPIIVFSSYAFGVAYASGEPLLQNYEWLAIFSLIPIFLYNGQRGGGHKYFFYFFYPLHIYLIYLSNLFLIQ